jgi:hypothetical protein
MPKTVPEINELTDHLQTVEYTSLFAEFETDQRLYDNDINIETLFPGWTGSDLIPVTIPFGTQFINTFTDHIVQASLRASCPEDPNVLMKDESQASADKILREQFLRFFWSRVNRNTSGIRPFRDAAKLLGLRGQTAMELVVEPNRRGFPYRVQVHDPWSLLPDPSPTNKEFVIHSYQAARTDVERMYPNLKVKRDTLTQTPGIEYLDVTRYVDKDEYVVLVNRELADRQTNHLGFFPFAWGYNGLGLSLKRSDQNRQGDERQHEHAIRSRSLLFPIRNLIENSVRLDTLALRAVMNAAVPPVKAINLDAEEVDLDPGKAIELRQEGEGGINEDIQFTALPPLDPEMARTSQRFSTFMELLAGTRTLSGVRQPGTSAALEFELQVQQSRLLFGEAQESFQHLCERMGEMALEDVDKNNRTITVAFQEPTQQQSLVDRTIKPERINGFYDNEVTLMAPGQDQIDERALATRVSMATPAGGPSLEYALSIIPGFDMKAERRAKFKEQVQSHPALVEAVAMQVAQALSLRTQEALQEAEGGSVEAGLQQALNDVNAQRQSRSLIAQGEPGNRNNARPFVPAGGQTTRVP